MPPRSRSPPPSELHRHGKGPELDMPAEDVESPARLELQSPLALKDQTQGDLLLPPTISLPILVIIDMFAVSLVVPLLLQYYSAAGVTVASQRELLSSLFSASQIIGGLLLGALADTGFFHRRTILFISFIGSALSYALIVYGGFWALVCSRVLVGLVKQTMTVTTTMIARYTTKEDRATHIGRLKASSTVAWIVGPSVGAFLYKNVDKRAPPLLACALFLLNLVLAAVLLPRSEEQLEDEPGPTSDKKTTREKISLFASNLRSCFSSKSLGSLVASTLISAWVARATSYSSMASYYEQFYGIEPHERGYLSSYQQTLTFVVQSLLIGPLLSIIGGERRATVASALLLATATWMELQASLPLFLIVLCPVISLSVALMGNCLHTLVTHVAPKESLGSVFAAIDVMQNAAAVTVPFYRTFLFSLMGSSSEATMKGDPNPRTWIMSSGLHWCFATVAMGYFLLSPDGQPKAEKRKRAN